MRLSHSVGYLRFIDGKPLLALSSLWSGLRPYTLPRNLCGAFVGSELAAGSGLPGLPAATLCAPSESGRVSTTT